MSQRQHIFESMVATMRQLRENTTPGFRRPDDPDPNETNPGFKRKPLTGAETGNFKHAPTAPAPDETKQEPEEPQMSPEALALLQKRAATEQERDVVPGTNIPIFNEQALAEFQKQHGSDFLFGIGWVSFHDLLVWKGIDDAELAVDDPNATQPLGKRSGKAAPDYQPDAKLQAAFGKPHTTLISDPEKTQILPTDDEEYGRKRAMKESIDPAPAIAQVMRQIPVQNAAYALVRVPGEGTSLSRHDGTLAITASAGSDRDSDHNLSIQIARFLRTILHLLNNSAPRDFKIQGKYTIEEYVTEQRRKLIKAKNSLQKRSIKIQPHLENYLDKYEERVLPQLLQALTNAEKMILKSLGTTVAITSYDRNTGRVVLKSYLLDDALKHLSNDMGRNIYHVLQSRRIPGQERTAEYTSIGDQIDEQRQAIFQEIVKSIQIVPKGE